MKTTLLSVFLISTSIVTIIPVTTYASDSIPFNAGKWEITSQATMPMLPQPITNTNIECIKEDTISADRFAKQTRGNCTATDVNASGENIKWKMSCNVQGNQMTGYGDMQVNDTSLAGKATIAMSMQGLMMEMNTTWKGTRIGECK